MNDFNDIREDINWRKEELLTCKTLPYMQSISSNHKEFLIKYSIPIIYSLWEGFIQNSFQTYVRELNKLNLNKEQYCNNIILHSLESKFPQFKEYPNEYKKREIFIVKLDMFLTNEFIIPSKIDTESNVAFEVLNKLLRKFNLKEVPHYPYKEKLKNFLMFRNRISHGDISLVIDLNNIEDFTIKINDYIKLIEELMENLLEIFKEGYNTTKTYLKNPLGTAPLETNP